MNGKRIMVEREYRTSSDESYHADFKFPNSVIDPYVLALSNAQSLKGVLDFQDCLDEPFRIVLGI